MNKLSILILITMLSLFFIACGGETTKFNTGAPVISNGKPSGELTASTKEASLSIKTDIKANCRFSYVAGKSYSDMDNTFTKTDATSHTESIAGLVSGKTYNFYIRCSSVTDKKNSEDYIVSFSIKKASVIEGAPVISDGKPTGNLATNTKSTTLSVKTDIDAICKYSTNPDQDYSDMTDIFDNTDSKDHSTVIDGLNNDTSYTFYIKCRSTSGVKNETDYEITFKVLDDEVVISKPNKPLLSRGDKYAGIDEQFNRYYTEPNYSPLRTLYVSRTGSNSDLSLNSEASPSSVENVFQNIKAGDKVIFMKDETPYSACYEIKKANSGTYDNPIILYAQRNADGSRGVKINCCNTGRKTCLNFEGANYIAVDGFELEGGKYGVRAVGLGYDAEDHQKGIAVLNTEAYDNCADPFFTGASDWAVFEKNIGHHGGDCDGHGMYLSNGSDFNIVRYNELHSNKSSDFQINADPASCCVGANPSVPYNDERCYGLATDGLGRGASDYMHIEGNYFHNGFSQGPNFTSVRHSKVINNIIALYQRHGTSFWQETPVSQLGSSDNTIEKNLFIGENHRHVVQFVKHSTRNSFKNNIIIGLTLSETTATSNTSTALVNADGTVSDNMNENNFYISGKFDGYTPNNQEVRVDEFDSSWFVNFPYDRMGRPADWKLTDSAPHNKFNNWSPVDFDNLED